MEERNESVGNGEVLGKVGVPFVRTFTAGLLSSPLWFFIVILAARLIKFSLHRDEAWALRIIFILPSPSMERCLFAF